MREILFRGKQKYSGKWVYGSFFSPIAIMKRGKEFDADKTYTILPETVGQFTGLTDKNGKKIFEGDIVKGTFLGFPIPIKDYVFSICWQEDVTGYRANYFENVEVIGNIHDSPELLEVNK